MPAALRVLRRLRWCSVPEPGREEGGQGGDVDNIDNIDNIDDVDELPAGQAVPWNAMACASVCFRAQGRRDDATADSARITQPARDG